MKKIICLLIILALCTSCAKHPSSESQSVVPTQASTSVSIASETSSANMASETSSAEKKIVSLPATLHIDSLTDATVAAAFEPSDLAIDSAGIPSLNLTVYDYELFDIVDVSTLSVGDTIVASGKEFKIDTLEINDTGLIIINGDIENGGLALRTEDNTVYFTSGMDGYNTYYEVGQAPFKFSNDFKFIDNSDLDNPNQEFTYDEFVEKLQSKQTKFTEFNTTVLIVNEAIVEITVCFLP